MIAKYYFLTLFFRRINDWTENIKENMNWLSRGAPTTAGPGEFLPASGAFLTGRVRNAD